LQAETVCAEAYFEESYALFMNEFSVTL